MHDAALVPNAVECCNRKGLLEDLQGLQNVRCHSAHVCACVLTRAWCGAPRHGGACRVV